ncbi:MAG: glutamate mutase L, partial [Fimbriimonas ginsengisoli]|nr:glutamate mutase L [Fimbriimonas ginsengisoli]
LKETGIENIARWLPFEIDPAEVRNRLRNKMIRPTTIPHTYEDLLIEQAVAREALRLAFAHHKTLARGLTGLQQQRDIGQIFDQQASGQTLVNMMELAMIIGSGGVLSHAPRRAQSALMMMDAYQPEGVTDLTVDSIFMMPHLGVLSEHHYEAARQVFEYDCIVRCGPCVAPVGLGKEGDACVKLSGQGLSESVPFGTIKVFPLAKGETKDVEAEPARGFDLGAGKGKSVKFTAVGGTVGLIVDTRGRPFTVSLGSPNRIPKLLEYLSAFGLPLPGGERA